MPGKPRVLMAAAIAVPVIALAGCGDGDDAAGEPTSSASSSAEVTESPSESGSTPADPSETTAPGAVLKLGETATVPIDDDGVVAITPVSVDQAPAKEVRGDLEANEVGWYAWLEVEIVSETKGGDIQLSAPGVNIRVMSLGDSALNLPYSRDKSCGYPFEPAKPGPGDTWKTCVPVKLAKGQAPEELMYTELGGPYDRVDGKPVVWQLDS